MASEEQTRPDKAEQAVAELEERLALLERERDEYLADLKRVAAEFDNFRKRVARDQEAQAVYQKVQAEQAGSQPAGDGNGASDEDEVVEEADYEVIDEEAKRS